MKRSLFCLLFVAAFVPISGPVLAQELPAATAPDAVADSSAKLPTSLPEARVAAAPSSFATVATLGVAPVMHISSDSLTQPAEGGIKGFFFGSRRRTSNTLMIGGVTMAGIGVGLVKGEVGAVIGVLGLLSSIGGLYLAF